MEDFLQYFEGRSLFGAELALIHGRSEEGQEKVELGLAMREIALDTGVVEDRIAPLLGQRSEAQTGYQFREYSTLRPRLSQAGEMVSYDVGERRRLAISECLNGALAL